ncbi:hypothetical protein CASFOL_030976 [Castilleja foliolosa]|uniref:Dirigent protein n=1 Tax=Castilleja foliolosa TaxID=1961234 RepID=A0ABD3C7G6_9LAMI
MSLKPFSTTQIMSTITFQKLTLFTIFTILFLISNLIPITNSSHHHHHSNKGSSGRPKSPKLTNLHFYFHDIVSGPNRTAVPIVPPTTNSSFGSVSMIDDPLTAGPSNRSRVVGRAQGFYASADQKTLGLLMVMNFVFTDRKFNGSTLSVLGRNEAMSLVREMAIVGGTGAFRFCHGYALARTQYIDSVVAVVEYNVTILHY